MNPTEPNVPAIRQRRPMTEARLKANRENAKKAALSGRSGRPRGSMDGNRLSLRERCRVRDEEHVATLERIAADDRGFWSEVQRVYENRICTSLPSSLSIAWNGVLKPRHFLGVRLAVRTMSWISSSDTLSISI